MKQIRTFITHFQLCLREISTIITNGLLVKNSDTKLETATKKEEQGEVAALKNALNRNETFDVSRGALCLSR